MSLSQSQDVNGRHQIPQDKSTEDEVIRKHHDFLVDLISPEFGLIDKLYTNRVLSIQQRNEIETKSVIHRRNEILLKHIVQKKACKKLLEALKMCDQSHLVKYLEADGAYRPEFGGHWPLTEKENMILLENYESLIDTLDSRDLVGLLYQTGVVNMRERDLVSSSKWTIAEQNKALLEILRKGSLDCYWQTIRCLHLSNQSHIARIFELKGAVVRIDANLHPKPSNLTEIENSLATEITNLLRHSSLSDSNRILERVQLNLVAVAAKHSISFYFLCSKPGDTDRLKQSASDGQFKEFLEDLFNCLMKFPTRMRVALKWSRRLFSKSRKYIEEIQVKKFIKEPMKSTIHCLPMELLDTILQRAYFWSSKRSGSLDGDKGTDIVRLLASVDTLWFQRILRKRFKKSIWPQLQRILRREYVIYLRFKNCLRYLEEAIQVGEIRFVRQDLVAADLLTDLQIAKQQRKKIKKYKQRRQSWMLISFAEEIHKCRTELNRKIILNNFIRCIRRTNPTYEARVFPCIFQQEGTTAKVEIRQEENTNANAWSRKFCSKLESLRDRNRLKSDDIKMIFQEMKDCGLEILDSFMDRGVIVWIWCKSQSALETLKELNKSQTLAHRLANENYRNRRRKDIHLENLSQLKIVSLRNPVIKIDGELHIKATYVWPIGVTKLRSKIFVLGRSFSSFPPLYNVYVFDDQRPFSLQQEMTFDEINNATDILSFEKSFCLYVTGVNCVWKISPPDEDQLEDGKFSCTVLEFPELQYFRMTITDRGQILIIGERDPILLFCESESALNCPIRIDLPDAIKRPFQLAENSAGNFVFLHRTLDRYSSDGEDQWVVSEVGRNGKTIIRQSVEGGDRWLDPNGKAFLLTDPKNRIFISDRSKHRLILFDSSLRYVSSFRLDNDGEIEENRLLYPRKMFYDGGKNHLFIVGLQKTLVYNVSGF